MESVSQPTVTDGSKG